MSLNFDISNQITTLPIANATVNDGWILLGDNTIRHNSTKTTRISKNYINKFIIGNTYKVNFTVDNYISCSVKIIIDGDESEYSSDGIKQVQFVATSTSQEIIFESDGYLDITNINIIEVTPSIEVVDIQDTDLFENRSFTASWDLINNKWISYHDYLPTNYIRHNTDFLMYDHTAIKKAHSKILYAKAIIEMVFNDDPAITKVLNSLTTNLESYSITDAKVNDFFDKLLVHTEIQSSGLITLNSTNLTKKEKNWNISNLLDVSKGQSSVKLFSNDWADIKDAYFIDKVVKADSLDLNKPWFKRGRFRDKYFVARFIYDNLENNKIMLNFVNATYRLSQR